MTDVVAEYRRRYDAFLRTVAARLQVHLQEHLAGVEHIDRVTARAKAPDRFAAKTQNRENGRRKYSNPLTQIQDQIGARVIVFYIKDVESVSAAVKRYFTAIEQQDLVPESEWEFGYFGQHFILSLPKDVIPQEVPLDEVPRFFELQIKTLFQHAWSEAEHDLGYKASQELSSDQKRRLAYAAAQAWGADRMFDDLYSEMCRSQR